jgi:hypothetical protein
MMKTTARAPARFAEARRVLGAPAPARLALVRLRYPARCSSAHPMVSPETRDRIVEKCPDRQLGDAAIARDLYADLRGQLVRDPERQYDTDVSGRALCTGGKVTQPTDTHRPRLPLGAVPGLYQAPGSHSERHTKGTATGPGSQPHKASAGCHGRRREPPGLRCRTSARPHPAPRRRGVPEPRPDVRGPGRARPCRHRAGSGVAQRGPDPYPDGRS